MNPPLRLLAAYQIANPTRTPDWVVQAPGREMWAVVEPASDGKFTLISLDHEGRATFDVHNARRKRTHLQRPLPTWARYASGVAVLLSEDDWTLPGIYAQFAGDEPAGPRYDHALGLAFALILHQQAGVACDEESLLVLLDRVQKHYLA